MWESKHEKKNQHQQNKRKTNAQVDNKAGRKEDKEREKLTERKGNNSHLKGKNHVTMRMVVEHFQSNWPDGWSTNLPVSQPLRSVTQSLEP